MRLWETRSNAILLSEILSTPETREELLGMERKSAPTPEQQEKDADKIIQFARSMDYHIFAKELWSKIIASIDALGKENLSDRQVDFHRGNLASSLDALRISYRAHIMKQMALEQKKSASQVRDPLKF